MKALPICLLAAAVLGLCVACGEPNSSDELVDTNDDPSVTKLGKSAQFRGINGIHFGPDGALYLVSVVTPAVAKIDPETGEILEQWGREDGPKSPDDLAFGPDGSLYWTDISDGEVAKRTPAGETQIIANLGPGPNPITFSDDGRLFVSQCFMDTKLFELDPSGEAEPRVIRDDLGPGCGLNGMDWGSADGRLYGPRWFTGEVVRVDVDSGDMETVADGFGVPAAVKFDSQGRLHVLDTLKGEVVRVNADGSKDVVASIQPGLDNLAFSDDDQLFVSSFADGFIVEATGDGNRVVLKGGLNMPGGLALLGSGESTRLVLADFFALRQLDPSDGTELSVMRDVIGFSEMGSVMSVHAHGDQLVLSSWFDNAVKIWDPTDDSVVQSFTGLAAPIDALLTSGGTVVASQWAAGNVVAWSPDAPEDKTILASELAGPAGLTELQGDLYVTVNQSGTVLKIAAGTDPVTIAEGLDQPEGIASSGTTLYVVESGARQLTAIDLETGTKTVVASDLEIHVPPSGSFPNTMLFNGVVVDGEGTTAWVAGDVANTVYRIGL